MNTSPGPGAHSRTGDDGIGPVHRPVNGTPRPHRFSPFHLTIALIAAVTAARLAYLLWLCPYTLVEDEAHYWEWSRRLELSYYSKGPGVAWLIAASTRFFGDTQFAVRLPAVLSAAVACLAVAGLATDVSKDRANRWGVGLLAAACFLLTPMFQVIGLVMTIDGPLAACWACAAWAGWRAVGGVGAWGGVRERRPAAFVLLGLALGAGVLFKYTMLLGGAGVLLYAIVFRQSGPTSARLVLAQFAAFLLLAAGLAPMILWNADEGWPTIRHLLGHLGVAGGDVPVTQGAGLWHYRPQWTLELLAAPWAMVGPILGLAVAEAVLALRRRKADTDRWRREVFLIFVSAPTLVFYLLISLVAEPEGNWVLPAFITMMPLAAQRIVDGMGHWRARVSQWRAFPHPRPRWGFFRRSPETPTQIAWTAAIIYGLVTGVGMLRLDLLARVPVVGGLVPLRRFMGADDVAASAAALAATIQEQRGDHPIYMTGHYGLAGQLAFYLPGHPTVYCASRFIGGRASQFDYWLETDLQRADWLVGRPAVLIGAPAAAWSPFFDQVTVLGPLKGDAAKGRTAVVGIGFKGVPR